MSEQFLLYASIAIVSAVIGGGIIIILAASWYDLRSVAKQQMLQATIRRLRAPQQPSLVVLIYAHNNAATIAQCLASVAKSHYHDFTIVVVDNRSTDITRRTVRDYGQMHPKLALRLYATRKTASRDDVLRRAYRATAARDFVLTLNATDTIDPNFLKASVAHLVAQPHYTSVTFHRRHVFHRKISEIVPQLFEHGEQLLRKTTPASWHRLPAVLSHHATFLRPAGARYYASTLALTATRPATWLQWPTTLRLRVIPLTILRIAIFAILFGLMSYFFFTAATYQSNALLIFSWIAIGLWALVAIWSSTTTRDEKIALTWSAPLAYLLLYIWLGAWLLSLPIRLLGGLTRQRHRTSRDANRHRYQRYILDNILALKAWYEEMWPREVWHQDQWRANDHHMNK